MIGIDSSVLIDIMRGKIEAKELDRFLEEGICTSEIVTYEILYGFHKAEHFSRQQFENFDAVLDTFSYVFPIDRKASVAAAEIAGKLAKAGQTIQHSDALIAGSLLANGCRRFLTRNISDFDRIKELEIETL